MSSDPFDIEPSDTDHEVLIFFAVFALMAVVFGFLLGLAVTEEIPGSSPNPLVEQPAPPLAPGPLCVVVSELDMMEGRTMSRFQPYFDMGLTSCLVIYRPNTEDYSVCFCEVKR